MTSENGKLERADALESVYSRIVEILECAHAKLRLIVKCIQRRYGYPPNKQEQTITTVLSR